MGLFVYTQKGSIISMVDLPTTEIIEPQCPLKSLIKNVRLTTRGLTDKHTIIFVTLLYHICYRCQVRVLVGVGFCSLVDIHTHIGLSYFSE